MIDRRALLVWGIAAALPLRSVRAQGGTRVEDSCEYRPLASDTSNASLSSADGASAATICNSVADQVAETGPGESRYRWVYRKLFYWHSSADILRDPASHVAKKIQHFWVREHQRLVCTQLGFSVTRGSLLKLAVEKNARHFVDDAVRRWQLWLNPRDQSGHTLLDYVDEQLARHRGGALEPVMRRYRDQIVRFGAKRASELTTTDLPFDPYDVELRPLLRSWQRACYFNEGLAAVKRGGLWGYVNEADQVVVQPSYHGAFAFSNGRAAVHRDGRWGYIDATGNEVIPLRYADARVFSSDGLAEVTTDGRTWTRINSNGAAA